MMMGRRECKERDVHIPSEDVARLGSYRSVAEKDVLVDTDGISTNGQREKAKEKEDNPPSPQIKEYHHADMLYLSLKAGADGDNQSGSSYKFPQAKNIVCVSRRTQGQVKPSGNITKRGTNLKSGRPCSIPFWLILMLSPICVVKTQEVVKVSNYSNCPGDDCVILCQCNNQGNGVVWWNGSWFSSIGCQFSCYQNGSRSCSGDTVIGTASEVCGGSTSSTLSIKPPPNFSGDLMCYFHNNTSREFVPVGKLTFSRPSLLCNNISINGTSMIISVSSNTTTPLINFTVSYFFEEEGANITIPVKPNGSVIILNLLPGNYSNISLVATNIINSTAAMCDVSTVHIIIEMTDVEQRSYTVHVGPAVACGVVAIACQWLLLYL